MSEHVPFKLAKPGSAYLGRVYVPIDPEYTISKNTIMALFGWTLAIVRKKQKLEGFPAPKHFGQNCVRWHPQHINDWLANGGKV